MTETLFPSPAWPVLPVEGQTSSYPVHRIFCVGRNYAAHAAEMGAEVTRDQPMFFTKSALAFLPSGRHSAYPPGTSDYHFEVELCVMLGQPLFQADEATAAAAVYGYAVGLDMTRRDLQARAKDARQPWDMAKDVEESAVIAAVTPAAQFGGLDGKRIRLLQNGEVRQDSALSDMVWSVPELLSRLSGLYHLAPGDVLMTGTPAGVGPVAVGDRLVGEVDGLAPVSVTYTDPE